MVASLQEFSPQRQEFVIRVGDPGPGIPEDLRDTIFEPFVRGRQTGEGADSCFVVRLRV